ncbi:regulator of chromosome condensation (RCC1) repeat-containing protein [Besnoitia besnoiti]|uniref:Regulator of chromosome condensation (RCC1) repeat-containing protein n=1 Tax=Besnoitia besnoiti TaxID=94643 RepID=A0A2A9MNH6_BESBE|nr:regulator of chromosome condensation (RCC1) repeat-containing protein [Besnoitia besnoiti]PFH37222.1 regulator of chromosome condensation (RCC1) repeat-containing protein [Besnoitia besnoiti]
MCGGKRGACVSVRSTPHILPFEWRDGKKSSLFEEPSLACTDLRGFSATHQVEAALDFAAAVWSITPVRPAATSLKFPFCVCLFFGCVSSCRDLAIPFLRRAAYSTGEKRTALGGRLRKSALDCSRDEVPSRPRSAASASGEILSRRLFSSSPSSRGAKSSSWSLWYLPASSSASSARPQELLRLPPTGLSSSPSSSSSTSLSAAASDASRGQGEATERVSSPITSMAVGRSHGACVVDGRVFCFGRTNARGQLGVPSLSSSPFSALLSRFSSLFSASPASVELVEVEPPQGGWKGKVIKVACGAMHTCALTDLGYVYSWGAPSGFFQGSPLGVGDSWRRLRPTLVTSLVRAREHVTDIACGPSWTLCATASNRVYSTGRSDFGVMGRGASSSSSSFHEIEFFQSVLLPSAPSPLAYAPSASNPLSASFLSAAPLASAPGVPFPSEPGVPTPKVRQAAGRGGEATSDALHFEGSLSSFFGGSAFPHAPFEGLPGDATAAEMRAQLFAQMPAELRERMAAGASRAPHGAESPSPAASQRRAHLQHSAATLQTSLPRRPGGDQDAGRGVRTPDEAAAAAVAQSARTAREEASPAGYGVSAGGFRGAETRRSSEPAQRTPAPLEGRGRDGVGVRSGAKLEGAARSGCPPELGGRASAARAGAGVGDAQKGKKEEEAVLTYQDEVRSLSRTKVKQLVCGEWQSLLVTDDGRLWVWGRNEDGQLGKEVEAVSLEVGRKAVTLSEARALADAALESSRGTAFLGASCAPRATKRAAATARRREAEGERGQTGTASACDRFRQALSSRGAGRQRDRGFHLRVAEPKDVVPELGFCGWPSGLAGFRPRRIALPVESACCPPGTGNKTVLSGTSLPFSPYPMLAYSLLRGGTRVAQVAAGATQSFALSEDGGLYAWGGLWGRQPVAATLHPRFERSPIKGKVTKVAGGWRDSGREDVALVITDVGDLYVWSSWLAAALESFQCAGRASAAASASAASAADGESDSARNLGKRGEKEPFKADRDTMFDGGAVRDAACGPFGVLLLVQH